MSLIIQAHIAIISFFASWTWVILFHLINFKVGAIIIAIPLAFFVFLHLILISRSTSDLLQVSFYINKQAIACMLLLCDIVHINLTLLCFTVGEIINSVLLV